VSPRAALHVCLVLTLDTMLFAQQPAVAPSPPAAPPASALQRAFVEADGSRVVISAAADQLIKEGAANRAKFVATVGAIAAVAPKPAKVDPVAKVDPALKPEPGAKPEPAPAAGASATPAATKPVEIPDETRRLMATVVTGGAEESKAALARLAEDPQAGAAALQRLDERGKAILARTVVTLMRRKMETNAFFAGQYAELRDFEPEAGALLLRWVKEPPRDAPSPAMFPVACVRALRDVVPAEQATEAIRGALREVIGKAQKARDQQLFLAAACALHQFGDPSVFDKVKTEVEKQAAAEDAAQKTEATNTLADLHYQLRKYDDAANYYKAAVDLVEKSGQQPQGLSTMIYNTACSLALAKRNDEAFVYLEKALQLGAKGAGLSKVMIDADHDMDNLRTDERFAKLMAQFFGKPVPHGK